MYSKKQIDKAGKVLTSKEASPEEIEQALSILNSHRGVHAAPLNTIANNLTIYNPDAIIVQRLKRLDSIVSKLERFPQMRLFKMQDLGGCRVILNSIDQVYQSASNYKSSFSIKRENDYIQNPKVSGYRSYHIVCQSKESLLIEIQFRTHLQHLWATAVEIMSIHTQTFLKASMGKKDILRFLTLVSSLFAIKEGTPVCPNTSNASNKLVTEIKEINDRLHILETLSTMAASFNELNKSKGYYLMSLDILTHRLEIQYFPMNQLKEAIQTYNHLESLQIPILNIVLVSASSFDSLKRAYPNYFLDVNQFISIMKEML